MNRLITLFATMMLLLMAAGAQAGITTLASLSPATNLPGLQIDRWMTELESRTGEHLDITVHPESENLDAEAMLRNVISGSADIGYVSLADLGADRVELPLGTDAMQVTRDHLMQMYTSKLPLQFRRVEVVNMYVSEHNEVIAVIMNRRAYRQLPGAAKAAIEQLASERSAWAGRFVDTSPRPALVTPYQSVA